MSLSGHFWTIAPKLRHRFWPPVVPKSQAWSTWVTADTDQPVRLSGALCDHPGSRSLVVIVHGLGGAIDSDYCLRAASAADAHGFSSLRLALRGADRSGEDFYHAGLASDLEAAFQSPELARYAHLFVLGFSLGGHVSLHAAVRRADSRLHAVVAVCAPLDLEQSVQAIDDPRLLLYRHHVLSGLKEIYRAVAQRKPVPTPLAEVLGVKTIRQWDALTVVPRFGFANTDDYYAKMSVGFVLDRLSCPTLLLQSRHDPMVPPWTFSSLLPRASSALQVRWVQRGGHVGFPAHVALEDEPTHTWPIETHVMRWLHAYA